MIIDDIKYDSKYCGLPPPVISPFPLIPTTETTETPWTVPTIAPFTLPPPFITTTNIYQTTTNDILGIRVTETNTIRPFIPGNIFPYTTPKPFIIVPEPMLPFGYKTTTTFPPITQFPK